MTHTLLELHPRPSRNFIYLLESKLIEEHRKKIIAEIIELSPIAELDEFAKLPFDEVCLLHMTLGAIIRNMFDLWNPEHPVTQIWYMAEQQFPLHDAIVSEHSLLEHIEDHPCNPDNFSMSCIRQLWEMMQ